TSFEIDIQRICRTQFELISALLPPPKVRGRKPTDFRTILNAMFYMIRVGCPWRLLPKDFPPFTTVQNRFYAWRNSGLWTQIIGVLVMAAREDEGRQAAPTAVVVDSSRRRKRAGLAASTQARKSRAASDISRWIHSACQSSAKSHPQVSKIETHSRPCSARFIVRAHGLQCPLSIAAIKATRRKGPPTRRAE